MSSIDFERTGAIGRLTLDRRDKLNAIDAAMLDELEDALGKAEADDRVRAIVLAGRGRAFSAGFDLNEPHDDGVASSAERIRRELTRDFEVIMRFWDCPKPIVAAVHGYCLGSAMELTAVCDITIAADDARFGAPEVTYGSGIVCLILPWILGYKKASELLLTGRKDVAAPEAERIGLVNRVVPAADLQREALAVARTLAANDALALRLTRKAIRRSFDAAGFRDALATALEHDIEIETTDTPESLAFNKKLAEEGLKAALAWRAAAYE